jgi:hypothetical protein
MAKRVTLLLVLVLGLAGAAWAGQLEDQEAEIQDILLLAQQGFSDEVIIKHIEARGFVYDLTVDDILDLRDRGLSEDVIEAMIDTAVDEQPSQRERVVDRDTRDTQIYLSAGYFSPWYRYPYAWGFYYDPFPVCYGAYYYPFSFSIGWGWYGSCHYWYPTYWTRYRWSSPYYWDYARTRPHHWRAYPRYASTRWDNGRGLHNDRTLRRGGEPVHQGGSIARREAQPATRVHAGQTIGNGRRGEAVDRRDVREVRPAERVRTPSSARTSQPATGRGSTTVIRRPSSSPPIERQISRERVHTRPSYRAPSRDTAPPARQGGSAVAPRTTPRAPQAHQAPQVRTPRSPENRAPEARAPSRSSLRVPSQNINRPPAPSHAGGRSAAPAGRGSGGHLH